MSQIWQTSFPTYKTLPWNLNEISQPKLVFYAKNFSAIAKSHNLLWKVVSWSCLHRRWKKQAVLIICNQHFKMDLGSARSKRRNKKRRVYELLKTIERDVSILVSSAATN
ncbi:unnamed protein product, partial [Allacma fusca]